MASSSRLPARKGQNGKHSIPLASAPRARIPERGGRFGRPGRTPLGISFELVTGDSAADRVPPLVHMDREQEYRRYFAAEKK